MTHPAMRESDLLLQITDWLDLQPCVMYHRQNVGTVVHRGADGRKRFVKFGKKGMADLIGCCNGLYFAVETKVGKNKQTEDQIDFALDVQGSGGIYVLAYSLDDVIAALPVRQKRLELAAAPRRMPI